MLVIIQLISYNNYRHHRYYKYKCIPLHGATMQYYILTPSGQLTGIQLYPIGERPFRKAP